MPTAGQAAGIGREPVDVLEGEAGVGHRLEAGVDGQREGVDHEAPAELRPADPAEHGAVLEALGADRWPRRRAHRGGHPVDRDRSRRWARRAATRRPRAARSGPRPLGRCARRPARSRRCSSSGGREGSSARATLAMTYGGSKSGSHRCALTVNPTTVARPETSVGFDERLAALGADRGGRVDELAAVPAALDAQDAVGPRRPEPLVGRRQLRKRRHPGSSGLGPASHLPGPGQY